MDSGILAIARSCGRHGSCLPRPFPSLSKNIAGLSDQPPLQVGGLCPKFCPMECGWKIPFQPDPWKLVTQSSSLSTRLPAAHRCPGQLGKKSHIDDGSYSLDS